MRRKLDLIVWSVLGLCMIAVASMLVYIRQQGIRVTRFEPDSRQAVSALSRISIEFQVPMVADSVESRLLIQSAISGRFDWDDNAVTFTPDRPLSPDSDYSITLLAGARAVEGGVIKEDLHWEFKVRAPQILYMAPSRGPTEIWKVSAEPGNAAPTMLTDTGGSIFDFAVSPDGATIAYSVFNDEGGIDLWLMTSEGEDLDPIIECGADVCTNPAWSPDGRRLAYSREERPAGGSGRPGPPRIWTVAISSGQTAPLFQDSQILGYGPSFSPDGRRLALFDGNIGGIRILNLETGEQEILESRLGLVGDWSSDGKRMLFNVLRIDRELPVAELLLADFEEGETYVVLGSDSQYNEPGEPEWSPAGEWIALTLRPGLSGPGKELWLIRLDGEQAVPVARDPDFSYGGYRWDPWGQALTFQRFPLGVGYAKPDIMIWEMGSTEARLLVSDAWWARWLP